jgi:hypothetical protein
VTLITSLDREPDSLQLYLCSGAAAGAGGSERELLRDTLLRLNGAIVALTELLEDDTLVEGLIRRFQGRSSAALREPRSRTTGRRSRGTLGRRGLLGVPGLRP